MLHAVVMYNLFVIRMKMRLMEAEMSEVYPLRRSPLKYDFIATTNIETLLFDI